MGQYENGLRFLLRIYKDGDIGEDQIVKYVNDILDFKKIDNDLNWVLGLSIFFITLWLLQCL